MGYSTISPEGALTFGQGLTRISTWPMDTNATNAATTDAETQRTDIRILDGHESWQGVYHLLEADL